MHAEEAGMHAEEARMHALALATVKMRGRPVSCEDAIVRPSVWQRPGTAAAVPLEKEASAWRTPTTRERRHPPPPV